jgi:hypothetical protein
MAQTALQTLIFELKKQNQNYYEKWKAAKGDNKKMWNDAMSVQTICVIKAEKLLPKERQDIIDAYNAGVKTNYGIQTSDLKFGEKYFTQTFKKK